MKTVEHMGKIVEVSRVSELTPGDFVCWNGIPLTVHSVNGVVVFKRENLTLYEQRPSAKSQEWVEILKSNTHEKNKQTGF